MFQQKKKLVNITKHSDINLVGLNYKDDRQEARLWLTEQGNPYQTTIFDPDGKLALNLGVVTVPDTYVIDAAGKVRYHYVGEIKQEIWDEYIQLQHLSHLFHP